MGFSKAHKGICYPSLKRKSIWFSSSQAGKQDVLSSASRILPRASFYHDEGLNAPALQAVPARQAEQAPPAMRTRQACDCFLQLPPILTMAYVL